VVLAGRCGDSGWCSQSRYLSDDGGRVFFNCSDALVPQDINGAEDVYEWEADGVVYLVSSDVHE
jgi:hypothetical protein